ncbi:hypothetical protein ACH4FX_42565 [Streptomyces sp. NPDC018019]|uniref:hypothetical protein n=1 Tax=Streptomyces sp. NPDC018019 TaxID=3365030 RepID=UPI0037A24517
MDATEPNGRAVRAKFVDRRGETLSVGPGGFAVGTGLVDALAAVGDDEGDEGTGPGDHSEGEFHQVEERLGAELGGGVDLLEAEQQHQPVEDAARDQDCGGEGEAQCPADSP